PGQIGGNKAAAVGQKNSACDGCKRGAEMLLRLHDEYVCVQRFNSICSEKAEVLYLNVVGCKNNFYGAITHRRRRPERQSRAFPHGTLIDEVTVAQLHDFAGRVQVRPVKLGHRFITELELQLSPLSRGKTCLHSLGIANASYSYILNTGIMKCTDKSDPVAGGTMPRVITEIGDDDWALAFRRCTNFRH